MEQAICVEKMRTAILHEIDPKTVFSYPPPRPLMEWQPPSFHPGQMGMHPAWNGPPCQEGYDPLDMSPSISGTG